MQINGETTRRNSNILNPGYFTLGRYLKKIEKCAFETFNLTLVLIIAN